MSFVTQPFSPTFGAKKEISTTASASSATLIASAPGGPIQVRICNRGTGDAAYRFGGSSVAAVFTADPVLPAGGVEIVTILPSFGNPDIYVSTIAGGSIGTVEVTPGVGY